MTHEAMIILHHEDIRKAKEMLKNITKDLGAAFERLDTLERARKIQIEINERLIKMLEDDNG